ncbi:MAG: DNA primase [Verrucomicrobiota bacterium]
MAGLFSSNTLEQVRAASDIVDVIGGYVPLKRNGANFTALCPFHKEKSPSFNVNPHKQIFHCFGCHKGGDVFTFVKDYENIGFADAVRRLAERARIPLETENNPGAQQARHIKDTLLQIHEQITQRWQAALANDAGGQIARDYLLKRGVSAEAQKLFRLGYAPEAWDDTVNWAKSKGYETTAMEQGGLVIRKDGGDRYYDRFRGRLIFPICDEQGRVIGFSGRILSGDEKTAKYVNSPETPVFTKGKVFFGLDKSKRPLLDAHSAIVCEGQLDLIACYMAGVQNVVAPQGTALTADHARILKRYVDEVVLCFDSDNAGQNAAVRSLDSLLASGLSVRVATVPAPHDPDSFIKEFGGPAFRELTDNAEGFFDYYLDLLCVTNDVATDKGRVSILQSMSDAVRKTGNDVLLDKYAQKTAMRLGVAADSVRSEFKKRSRGAQDLPDEEEESLDEVESAPPSIQEITLLKLLLNDDANVEWARSVLALDWIPHSIVRSIISLRFDLQLSDEWRGVAGFLDQLENSESRSLVTQALADERPIAEPEKVLKGYLAKQGVVEFLRDKFIDRQSAALNQQMANPELNETEQIALWKQKQELMELKKQPIGRLR